MKYFLAFLFAFSLLACSSETKEAQKPKTTAILFFVDKTASVDLNDEYVGNKYKNALAQIIQENIQHTGDELEMYYVHENTAKARCLKLKVRASLDETEGMNATDLEAAQSTFDLMLAKEKKLFTKRAMDKLLQTNNGDSNKETDVLASVNIINEKCQEVDLVKVYFFSDMVESTLGGRDFHKNPPKASSEASEMAQSDLEKLNDAMLSNAEINVLLPYQPTSSSSENNPNISTYWQYIFEELGATFEEI